MDLSWYFAWLSFSFLPFPSSPLLWQSPCSFVSSGLFCPFFPQTGDGDERPPRKKKSRDSNGSNVSSDYYMVRSISDLYSEN